MKKRSVLLGILLLIIAYAFYQLYVFYLSPNDNLKNIYLIPKDAVYFLETETPIDNWKTVSNSSLYKHLQTNQTFKEFTQSLNSVNEVFNKQEKIIDWIGNRNLIISVHMITKKKYALFYVLDLQKIAKLNLLKNHISSFTSNDYTVTKRKYHGQTITELYHKKDRNTLYISFIKNQLIVSFAHSLVEASIDQYLEPIIGRDYNFIEINKKVTQNDLFRLYINYKYIDKYWNYFSDKENNIITNLSTNLHYTGLSIDFKNEETIIAKGYSNFTENSKTYIKALHQSGTNYRYAQKIAPKRTTFYQNICFNNFKTFYTNFESILSQNKVQYLKYQNDKDKIENYLGISINEHFVSWIDSEIALINMLPYGTLKSQETALVLKTKKIDLAKEKLNFVLERIRKKTPVKFKTIHYKKHQINYLSIKGFFKLFLGNTFKAIDKPYFTYIDNFVVFSNNPNTLKGMIDDYLNKNVLSEDSDFKTFNNNFDKKSSFFTYINTSKLYKNIYQLANSSTKKSLKKNKNYIICFPQIGIQFSPNSSLFKSNLIINYQHPDKLKNKDLFNELVTVKEETIKKNSKETPLIIDTNKDQLFNVGQFNLKDLNTKKHTLNYANGETHIVVNFKDGIKHGKYKEYYPNGEIKIKGKFKNGKHTGTWKAYNDNGNLIYKKKY